MVLENFQNKNTGKRWASRLNYFSIKDASLIERKN
jgi:hypothetical protein